MKFFMTLSVVQVCGRSVVSPRFQTKFTVTFHVEQYKTYEKVAFFPSNNVKLFCLYTNVTDSIQKILKLEKSLHVLM